MHRERNRDDWRAGPPGTAAQAKPADVPTNRYKRLTGPDRLDRDDRVMMVVAQLARLVPLSNRSFTRRLAGAMEEASRRGSGFFLPRFAARRALGAALIIAVEPRQLIDKLPERVEAGREALWIGDRFLGAGPWQDLLTPVRDSPVFDEVRQIVEANFDHRATGHFKAAQRRIAAGKRMRRNFITLRSVAAVESYFASVADTARSIAERGVIERRYMRVSPTHLLRHRLGRPWWLELFEADIGVAIAADGRLVRFGSGAHRMAAAILLNLTNVPVEVRLVHADWLTRQMETFRAGPYHALLEGIAAVREVHRPGG
jgi:hypothetical protein